MKIFITGGDGLLGSNLVRELLGKGHILRVLVQPGRETNTLNGLDLEKVGGDLLKYESLKAAAKNVEAIFHVAANTSIWPSRSVMVNKVNIEGTRNILRLAKELGIKKLVYVGTANTFSFGTIEDPILAVYSQKLPGYAPGGRNYICVKDAAKGIADALEKGKIGESYIIGNKNLSYKEAFGKMAAELGVSPPKLSIPKLALLAYGRLGSLIASITGRKPTVSYPMAKIACDAHYFTAEKAIRELDLPQTPIEEGIRESFNWLKANGYIDR